MIIVEYSNPLPGDTSLGEDLLGIAASPNPNGALARVTFCNLILKVLTDKGVYASSYGRPVAGRFVNAAQLQPPAMLRQYGNRHYTLYFSIVSRAHSSFMSDEVRFLLAADDAQLESDRIALAIKRHNHM